MGSTYKHSQKRETQIRFSDGGKLEDGREVWVPMHHSIGVVHRLIVADAGNETRFENGEVIFEFSPIAKADCYYVLLLFLCLASRIDFAVTI